MFCLGLEKDIGLIAHDDELDPATRYEFVSERAPR